MLHDKNGYSYYCYVDPRVNSAAYRNPSDHGAYWRCNVKRSNGSSCGFMLLEKDGDFKKKNIFITSARQFPWSKNDHLRFLPQQTEIISFDFYSYPIRQVEFDHFLFFTPFVVAFYYTNISKKRKQTQIEIANQNTI